MSPTAAAEDAIRRIMRHYPKFNGGIVAVNSQRGIWWVMWWTVFCMCLHAYIIMHVCASQFQVSPLEFGLVLTDALSLSHNSASQQTVTLIFVVLVIVVGCRCCLARVRLDVLCSQRKTRRGESVQGQGDRFMTQGHLPCFQVERYSTSEVLFNNSSRVLSDIYQ